MYQDNHGQGNSRGRYLLDIQSLLREALGPNTIRITRAYIYGIGEVPFVESTNMGPVMNLSLAVFNQRPSIDCFIATEESVNQNKPVCGCMFEPQPIRLKVGSMDSTLLLDYYFDTGEELHILGKRVKSFMVFGGVDFSVRTTSAIGPFLYIEYMDNPEPETYAVEYIHVECKDTGIAFEQHEVFRTPENPS